MSTTKIEWTATVHPDGTVTPGKTWNPTRGCSIVSPGCVNCYAMKQGHRFSGPGKAYDGLTKRTSAGPQWTGVVRLADERTLMAPYRWRTPCRIFVNSMSDLFHESLSNEDIAQVFHVMYGEASAIAAPAHTYQILTKRPARMKAWFEWLRDYDGDDPVIEALSVYLRLAGPHPRVWLGASAEDQQRADERIPLLLQTPAAVRFVSAEPLLGPIDVSRYLYRGRLQRGLACAMYAGARQGEGSIEPGLDWLIVGGESGAGARVCQIEWIERIVEQCAAAEVAVFVKQLGARPSSPRPTLTDWPAHARWGSAGAGTGLGTVELQDTKGGDPAEWPSALRVREFPQTAVSA